jgi:uncharacterized RDD family membrane protein YckC
MSLLKSCYQCRKKFLSDDLIEIKNVLVCAACKPIIVQKVEEFGAVIEPFKTAGFQIRVISFLLDMFMLLLILFAANLIFWIAILPPFLKIASMLNLNGNDFIGFILFGVLLFVIFFYFVYFVGKNGATPGKQIIGIQIIRTNGEPVGFGVAVARYFAGILSIIIFFIGFIWILFDEKYAQALHDKICKTRVVYVNKKNRPIRRRKME